ncbi:MAG: hypothetical protein U9R03_04760 [Candidatus Aerophobetes bacterium]|nr:hypothetical protein [Candidatus Aerophobetes bacterium]
MAKLKTTIYSPLFRGLGKGEHRLKEYSVGTVCNVRRIPLTYFAQKRPLRSPIFRGVEKTRRVVPPRLPPGQRYREYSIFELPIAPLAGIDIVREEVEKKARAEKGEIHNLRVLLEAGEITEEEYQKREREIRAKYEKIQR